MTHGLRADGIGIRFQVLSGQSPWPMFGMTQGPCWWLGHLSAKMDSSMKDSGGLVGHMDWCLPSLQPLPNSPG